MALDARPILRVAIRNRLATDFDALQIGLGPCDPLPRMHGMSIDAARAFNRTCPPGTVVEVALRDGSTRTGKTKGAAIVGAGYALVEVEGWPSYWTGAGGAAEVPRLS